MADTTQIIEFTDMYDKFLGRATIKGDSVTGSTEMVKNIIESYMDGHTAEDFIEYYSWYVNGYIKSQIVPD